MNINRTLAAVALAFALLATGGAASAADAPPPERPEQLAAGYTLRLVSAGMPTRPAQDDAALLARQADIITYWGRIGVTVTADPDEIEHVELPLDSDAWPNIRPVVFPAGGAALPADVVTVVVHGKQTASCYATGRFVVLNTHAELCAAHEFGHILGLGHSSAVLPGFGFAEYGNTSSVMGSGTGMPDYSQLVHLGLAPAAAPVSGTTTLQRGTSLGRVVSWQQRTRSGVDNTCYLEVRGAAVQAYTVRADSPGFTNTTTVIAKIGRPAFTCGKWVTIRARTATTIVVRVENS